MVQARTRFLGPFDSKAHALCTCYTTVPCQYILPLLICCAMTSYGPNLLFCLRNGSYITDPVGKIERIPLSSVLPLKMVIFHFLVL